MIKYSKKIILLLAILLFVYGFLLGGQQLIMGTVAEQFGIDVIGMGSLVSVLFISVMIVPPIVGRIADSLGKKRLLVIFTFLFGIGCFCSAVSVNIIQFIGSLLLIGAGHSVCESLSSAVCVDVDAAKGEQYINFTQCLLAVGAILGPIVMSNLISISKEYWRMLYIFCGLTLVIIGFLLVLKQFPSCELTGTRQKITPANSLWKSPLFLVLLISMFLYVGLETGFGFFVDLLFDAKKLHPDLSAYGISAYWAGMAISRLIYSVCSYCPYRTVRLSFIGVAAAFMALIAFQSGFVCLTLCALVGVAYGPLWTTIMAGAAKKFPKHKAAVTGLMSASCGLGGIVYPVLLGIIADMVDIQGGFVVLAISAVVGAALAFALKDDSGRKCI